MIVGGVHQSMRHLAEIIVRYADHQTGQHRGVFGQCVLDLGRVDVATTYGEHVHSPIGEIEIALLVEPAEVAE